MRILIAEDHPDNREMLTRRLERRGYEVHCAENGAEAVEKAKTCSPDLILMDISMPVMDGFEATEAIRARERGGRRTPIVAMTASAMRGDRERCLAAGMDGFLSKPIRVDALNEALAADRPSAGRWEPLLTAVVFENCSARAISPAESLLLSARAGGPYASSPIAASASGIVTPGFSRANR